MYYLFLSLLFLLNYTYTSASQTPPSTSSELLSFRAAELVAVVDTNPFFEEYLEQRSEVIIQQLETLEYLHNGYVEIGIILTDYLEGEVRQSRGIITTEPGFANSKVHMKISLF